MLQIFGENSITTRLRHAIEDITVQIVGSEIPEGVWEFQPL